MKPPDTTMGGSRGNFPDTTWGLLSRFAGGGDASGRAAGLEELCRRYWKPVYRYARVAWAKSNEDAKDLAQAFFVWLIEGETLSRYQPEGGSFRKFLRIHLGWFVGGQEAALKRLKRGGGVRILPLDGGATAIEESVADPNTADPGLAFDREWALAIMKHAIDRVRERRTSEGRAAPLKAFEAYDLAAEGDRPTYAELGARLGIRETDVQNHLTAIRAEVYAEIRAELARLTRDDRDLQKEWDELFGA